MSFVDWLRKQTRRRDAVGDLARDTRADPGWPPPGKPSRSRYRGHLVQQGAEGDVRFVWKDEVFKQFPLKLDTPPQEEFFTKILDVVGRRAKEAKRVEVAFESIAPAQEQFWSMDTADELKVPIGLISRSKTPK